MSREYITKANRGQVKNRGENRCEYCQSPASYATQSFVIQHIIPVSKDGSSELDNLAWSCGGFNSFKYNKVEAFDTLSQQNVSIFNPRMQKWNKHFNWSEDFFNIIGKTATGRATIQALKMNRTGLINLRTLLKLDGKHPPN